MKLWHVSSPAQGLVVVHVQLHNNGFYDSNANALIGPLSNTHTPAVSITHSLSGVQQAMSGRHGQRSACFDSPEARSGHDLRQTSLNHESLSICAEWFGTCLSNIHIAHLICLVWVLGLLHAQAESMLDSEKLQRARWDSIRNPSAFVTKLLGSGFPQKA